MSLFLKHTGKNIDDMRKQPDNHMSSLPGIKEKKWCFSIKITTLEQLQELILLEDLKNCVPENLVVNLNEQKITCLSNIAVLADKFVLTHRSFFSPA